MNTFMESKYKKWFFTAVFTIFASIIGGGIVNIVVDPFFHFHKPITKYRLYEERYINDGIARHFDYNAMIIGNSLTQNFKVSEFNELFGCNSIKTPYSGAGYREIWTSLDRNLSYQENTKLVLVAMDLEDLAKGPEWVRYSYTPEYMYDDELINDVNYIFNKAVLYRGTMYNLAMTILQIDNTSFDEYSAWKRESGPIQACASLKHLDADNVSYERMLSDVDLEKIRENVQINILPVLEKYENTRFIIIIPPSSIAKWAEYYTRGEINWRIDGLEYAIQYLIDNENVELYGFDDELSVTTDLELYSDDIHYDADVNSWILEEIYQGNHLVNRENSSEYIAKIRAFYNNFDYEKLNQYID